MSKTYYQHTINGIPGVFDGYQVCYANHYGPANVLCESLKQIRREQKASRENRKKDGLGDDAKLSYIRVRTP